MQLTGLRVVDLTRILAGPFCSQLLADLGAEVVKIEPPEGDPIRGQGALVNGFSAYFAQFNRGKRSVVLDLRSAAGKEALGRLIAGADIVVDNFRPGVMAEMGFGWERLQALRPGIIHTSVTGYGETGPYAERPSFDFVAQAMSGFMSTNGTPETGPMRSGIPISDLVAGLYAALGTVAAVVRRERTGQGERVGSAMLDGMTSLFAFMSAETLTTGALPPRTGNDHPLVAPYGLFTASDGDVAVAPSNDAVLRKFLGVLGLAQLLARPEYATNAERMKRREEVNALVNERMRTATRAHWIAVLNDAGVPCGVVKDLAAALSDPQVVANEMVLSADHPGRGAIRMTGFPMKFRNDPSTLQGPAPELGAHTESVLRAAGLTDAQIRAASGRG